MRQSVGELRDHLVFPGTYGLKVDRGLPKADTLRSCRAGHRHQLGERKQGLGRDTATQEAHPTEPWLVRDQRDIQSQISSTEGGGVSAWSPANDQHLGLDG
jgi:hypothetical protein